LALDPALYSVWAAVCTIGSARLFYGYMLAQTNGEWSAPLDDVFIHFDYARSTAQGHPFEWVAGNGYSSGNTSLTYPFVLAIGYLLGFVDVDLMRWAALVAMVCTFGTLLVARKIFLFEPKPSAAMRAGSYLLPPMVVWGVGALAWSLWSGMEVAWLLGVWACALWAFLHLDRSPKERTGPRAWWLGAWGAMLVATRPEAATTIAVFGVMASLRHRSLGVLLRTGSPAVATLAAQAIANRVLTGEWSQNGAIVKLAWMSPFLTREQKLADYTFNLKYAILRNTEYHFADAPAFGVIFPALAFAAIAMPHTRRFAVMLWSQIAGFLLLVSLNGQVRWQNERYTMPAVAWLLVCAALGAAGLFDRRRKPSTILVFVATAAIVQAVGVALRPPNTNPEIRVAWVVALAIAAVAAFALRLRVIRAGACVLALLVAAIHQAPKLRDQKWFFGRACRNIRDQHIVAGRWLKTFGPHRILVGDAGALIYASERPGLDIIGLGGYRDLPFARAGVQGLAATIELIERIPPSDRPDVFTIFPSWWGVLPTWFSSDVLARFPAPGNVICGGYEDVVYKADWSLLGTGDAPRAAPGGRIVDTLDVADLVSEKEHAYVLAAPAGGWTEMKILPDPGKETADLFDAGRRYGPGQVERFSLFAPMPRARASIVFRTVQTTNVKVRGRINGVDAFDLDLGANDGWTETLVRIDPERVTERLDVALECKGPGDFVDYHVWLVQ
jgi:hypothetical protein